MLALLLACAGPDPDALLRAHDLDGASAAWEKRHGVPLDVDHPVVQVLAQRAASDPLVTAASVADAMEAVRLLEATPSVGLRPLDLSFDRFAQLLGALGILARGPVLVVVGRSESGLDKDAYLGGALPWRGGRIVGWAREDLAALGERVDAEPVPRLVTLAARDGTGAIAVTFARRGDAWWTTAATDPDAGARLVLAANLFGERGARAVPDRFGSGLVGR